MDTKNEYDPDYSIGLWFTTAYIGKEIIDKRKDKNNRNEYLLNDGQ
jgi:hypothetical protein